MTSLSNDFIRFLYANYPDDYRKASVKDVPEDVLTAIVSRHKGHYEIWQRVPEWIKAQYADIIPKDVLNGNETVKDFVHKEETKKEEKEAAVQIGVSTLAAGFAVETAVVLAQNAQIRQRLAEAMQNGTMTPEQIAQWLATRESDRQAIAADWQKNQPEKYLIHAVKDISRQYKNVMKNGTEEEKKAAKQALAQEFAEKIAPLTQFLKSKEELKKFASYLGDAPQQAALRHMAPEVLDIFRGEMLKHGLKIEPATPSLKKAERKNLIAKLQDDFNQKTDMIKRAVKYKADKNHNRLSPGVVMQNKANAADMRLLLARRKATYSNQA